MLGVNFAPVVKNGLTKRFGLDYQAPCRNSPDESLF